MCLLFIHFYYYLAITNNTKTFNLHKMLRQQISQERHTIKYNALYRHLQVLILYFFDCIISYYQQYWNNKQKKSTNSESVKYNSKYYFNLLVRVIRNYQQYL